MKKSVIILGAGEQGRAVKNILELSGYSNIRFLDDRVTGKNVIGPLKKISDLSSLDYDYFVAIGDNSLRKKWFLQLTRDGNRCVNAIHPRAFLESSVSAGTNIMIGAFAYINIATKIGDNVIINTGCIIEHDNLIKNHSQFGPGVITAGRVCIGEETFIGMGSIIIDHRNISEKVVLGAGSVVIRDITESGLYIGVPAVKRC